jgi:hypothetical protein
MRRRITCWLCCRTYHLDSALAGRRDDAPCLDCQQREAVPGFEDPLWELAATWVQSTPPEVPFWTWVRISLIVARDQGRCDVCGWDLTATPERVRCVRAADQASTDPDSNDNLILLCVDCAAGKPRHATRAEYELWRDRGGWLGVLLGAPAEVAS